MTKYWKFWGSLTGLVLLVVGTEVGADSKWYAYASAGLAALAVLLFPKNTDG